MTIGSILGGGFAVIRRNPLAVLIWGAIYLIVQGGGFFIFFRSMASSMASMAALQAGGVPDPAAMQSMQSLTAVSWLFDIVLLLVMSVLLAAVFRSVFEPDRPGPGFLRFGMDEVRMIGLSLFFGILSMVALFLVVLVSSLIVGLLMVTAGAAAAIVIGLVLGVALVCAMIWLGVRFALSFPLTVMRGRITVGEAWRVSAGQFWTLFGALFVVWLIVAGVSLVIYGTLAGGYFAAIGRNIHDPAAMQAALAAQLQAMARPGPVMIVLWLAGAVVNTIGLALGGGTLATAAVELAGNPDADVEAAFL